MLNFTLIKRNCPIQIIFSNRSGNVETVWQLDIYGNRVVYLELCCKITFIGRVIDNMIVLYLFLLFYKSCKSLRAVVLNQMLLIDNTIAMMYNNIRAKGV